MPKSSPRKRAIDQKVVAAERDMRSAFAFVAKKRANIWFTAAGVLFVLGIAFAFLTIGDSAMQGNAAFLRASNNTGTPTKPITQVTPGTNVGTPTGTLPIEKGVRTAGDNPGTSSGGEPKIGVNNSAGNPYTEEGRDCSWKRPDQCAVTIEGDTSSVQGETLDFQIYATPQKKQCGPGDPGYIEGNPNSCQYLLALWPSISIDWGDGTRQSSNIRTTYKHTYLTAGTQRITVTARYNKQQFILEDGLPTVIESYYIAPVTHTVNVTVASSAVITAALNPGSRPAGTVANNATNVEFAKIDLTNTSNTAQTINALLVGCRDGYTPTRTNGTAGFQPFATNKSFRITGGSGGGSAVTFSSAREFFGAFPNAKFQFDAQLLFACKAGAFKAGTRSANAPITVPANGTTTISIFADVGQADPCTRLHLGVIAAYEGGGTGPLLANSVMGNMQVVPGVNPFSGETCSASTVSGSGSGGTRLPSAGTGTPTKPTGTGVKGSDSSTTDTK